MRFHLGTDNPSWLWQEQSIRHPLFISTRRLERYSHLKPSTLTWSLDSGGFTELNMYGEWRTTPETYVERIRRYQEIGGMLWASQQDWMCEQFVLSTTGLTVADHQLLTVNNLLTLRHLAADLPIIPVLQGWTTSDYLRHAEQFEAAGIDLAAEPIVGIGSVCRRADVGPIGDLIVKLSDDGIKLHGFGIKQDGIRRYGFALASADSMAWSFTARRATGRLCQTQHRAAKCNHCLNWAQHWADTVIAGCDAVPYQSAMAIGC
jgi:hypothetical protein